MTPEKAEMLATCQNCGRRQHLKGGNGIKSYE